MPILKRNIAPGEGLEAPTPKKQVYTPSPNSKLAGIPKEHLRSSAFIGLGLNEDPRTLDIDDIMTCLRISNNPEWSTEQATRNRIKGRLSAIRAFCVLCADGPRGARMCSSVNCPLWAFRMGTNPFHGKDRIK